jgi:mannosyltransferase
MKRLWKAVSACGPLGISAVVTLDIAIGVFLRFSVNSRLWLDETLSVNIASAPVGQIVGHLRNDGAPPLYYLLLHYWISIFGGSDFTVRALSGVFSLLGLVAAFFLARRLWGSSYAFVATAVLAVMPYGVYFGTEARMYSLVMLESALLLFVWIGDWETGARKRGLTALVLIALLLYTHYWSLYLVSVLFVLVIAQMWRGRSFGPTSRLKLLAILGGGAVWLPWLPIFNEQRLHTGTPWSPPPSLFQFLNWIDSFIVNQSRQRHTPSMHHQVNLYFLAALLVIGTFAVVMTERPILVLDCRVPQAAKFLVAISFGTMMLGLLASHFGGAAFAPRYASIVAIPLVLLAARGIMVLDKPLRILLVLLLFSGGMLWTDKWGRNVQRSQAGQVAEVLAGAAPGAYVFLCPDQIGPSVLRYARSDLEYSSYPRYSIPAFVNWYDYKASFTATSPAIAGSTVLEAAGTRDIYVVWSSGYTLKGTCKAVVRDIAAATGRQPERLLKARLTGFYQSMNVTFLPFHQ